MFEFFKPKKEEAPEETPKITSFEELKAALPEELKEEFQKLGEKASSMSTGGMDGREIEDDHLIEEEKKIMARYEELTKMAQGRIG